MKKDKDDKNDQRDRFEERLLNFVDRFADGNSRIVNNRVVEPGRETLFEFGHFLPHRIRSRERVRAGQLIDGNRGRRFSAESAVNRVIARRKFNPRDIAHACALSVRPGLNDDIAELLFVRQSALRTEGVLYCGRVFWIWWCDVNLM